MTDSKLMRLLLSIDEHNRRVAGIIEQIMQSSRPDACFVAEALAEQCLAVASAVDVASEYVKRPNKG